MKAVFLDRDGVVNELIYYQEQGIVDSPFTAEQFRLLPGVGEAIRRLNEAGYKVILASNQPGIAKGNMSEENFQKIIGDIVKVPDFQAAQGVYDLFGESRYQIVTLRKV